MKQYDTQYYVRVQYKTVKYSKVYCIEFKTVYYPKVQPAIIERSTMKKITLNLSVCYKDKTKPLTWMSTSIEAALQASRPNYFFYVFVTIQFNSKTNIIIVE